MMPAFLCLLDLLWKSQVGQAFSLTYFGNMDFDGLNAQKRAL
jgi:hypothetical protein